jgi:hypothetical protein
MVSEHFALRTFLDLIIEKKIEITQRAIGIPKVFLFIYKYIYYKFLVEFLCVCISNYIDCNMIV